MVELLLKDGLILDGTGRPGYRADVLVKDARIAAVGPALATTGRTVNVAGLAVAPGFIDMHGHSDQAIFRVPLADSLVMQGVTCEVVGNCGLGVFPVDGRRKRELEAYLQTLGERLPGGIAWKDMDGYARAVERMRPGINLACLVAHGALRIAAMGTEDRPPADTELAAMKTLLAHSLRQGAWGLSSGLIYPPGSFAATAELIDLARVPAACGAVYTSHIRGESANLAAAVEEAVTVAAAAGVRTVVSHLKAIGQPNWGGGLAALARLRAAREAGVDIWADQYPYEASATTLADLMPAWLQDGGHEAMVWRLGDADFHARVRAAVKEELAVRGGPRRVRISSVRTDANRKYVGWTVAEIAWDRLLAPEDAVIALLAEEGGAVGAIFFSLGRADVEGIIGSDFVAVASDGQIYDPVKDAGRLVHPRSYGTFPRVLGRYVRERGLLSWEAAVRKMTALPAAIIGLTGRGILAPGFVADIVVFDQASIRDRAEFGDPHQYAEGIEYVFVNGTPAVVNGHLTGDGRGAVLRRPR